MVDQLRTILISGVSKGIGHSLATIFLAKGHQVIGIGRSVTEDLLASRNFTFYPIDLTDCIKTSVLAKEIAKRHDVDVFIHNAMATPAQKPFYKYSAEELIFAHMVCSVSPVIMMQQLAPGMRKRRYGRIILIGSVVQEMGGRGQMAYITSKSALSGLTKSFASELGDRNITANLILLGPVETEKFLGNTSSEIVSAIKDKMPNQRLIPVEQICNAADYLMSDQSSFVNGATLHLSGGIHLKQI